MTELDRTITILLSRPRLPRGLPAELVALRRHVEIAASVTGRARELEIVAGFDLDEVDWDTFVPDTMSLFASDEEIEHWCAEHAVDSLLRGDARLVRTEAGPDMDLYDDRSLLRGSDEIPWPAWEAGLRDLVELWHPHDAHVGPHQDLQVSVGAWPVPDVYVGLCSYVADERPLDPELVQATPWVDGVLVRPVPGREAEARRYLSLLWSEPPREGEPPAGEFVPVRSDDGLVTLELAVAERRVVRVAVAPEAEGRPDEVARAVTQVANRVFDTLQQPSV